MDRVSHHGGRSGDGSEGGLRCHSGSHSDRDFQDDSCRDLECDVQGDPACDLLRRSDSDVRRGSDRHVPRDLQFGLQGDSRRNRSGSSDCDLPDVPQGDLERYRGLGLHAILARHEIE